MITELLHRIAKETKFTVASLQESIIAISERVNQKIQALILHGQAAILHEQIAAVYQELGGQLCNSLSNASDTGDQYVPDDEVVRSKIEAILSETTARVRLLKKEIMQVDRLIQEIEIDTLREDLLKLQYDLTSRGMLIQRIVVAPGAAVVGQHLTQLGFPSTILVLAVFRGPVVMPLEQIALKTGDIVILVGPQSELQRLLPCFREKARAFV